MTKIFILITFDITLISLSCLLSEVKFVLIRWNKGFGVITIKICNVISDSKLESGEILEEMLLEFLSSVCIYLRECCPLMLLGRSPVDGRGGQLEIAGVVVGSWGPNMSSGGRGGRGGNPMHPRVMSVGGPRR